MESQIEQMQQNKEVHSAGHADEAAGDDEAEGEYSFLQFHKVEDDNVTDESNTKVGSLLTEPDVKATVIFDGTKKTTIGKRKASAHSKGSAASGPKKNNAFTASNFSTIQSNDPLQSSVLMMGGSKNASYDYDKLRNLKSVLETRKGSAHGSRRASGNLRDRKSSNGSTRMAMTSTGQPNATQTMVFNGRVRQSSGHSSKASGGPKDF